GFDLLCANLVHDLEGDGCDHTGIVGQWRLGDQDQVFAVAQTGRDFRRGFLAGELAEVFLDVLDFERARFERVLLDQIFHQDSINRTPGWAEASAPPPRRQYL